MEESFLGHLVEEVAQLCAVEAASVTGGPEHVTRWAGPYGQLRQYSLLNRSGRYDDFSADHDLSCFGKRFRGGDRYPTLAHFIDGFAHAVNFRIHAMDAAAGLATHEEHTVIRAKDGSIGIRGRFHLPLSTNPHAELSLDGDVYHLERGSIFFVNNGCVHSAHNGGDETRTHLVWDLLLTHEMLALMFGDGAFHGLPLERVPPSRQTPSPLRTENVGQIRRLPTPVPEAAAVAPAPMEPQ